MNEGLIPRRYAKALYKVALEKGQTAEMYGLMSCLVASFRGNPDLNEEKFKLCIRKFSDKSHNMPSFN